VIELWLVRHGETEWSRSGRHTGTTDLPLTEAGEQSARDLARRLAGTRFDHVLTSPLHRAARTAELIGFADARHDPRLVEWDYGDYEGITTPEIRETEPEWTVWTHGARGGETVEQMSARMDAVLADVPCDGRALIVSHGHTLRALTARWLGMAVSQGRLIKLDTATVSVLGHEREVPVILRWNC
jgi:probable phosphoglycerate mutase